MMEWANLAAIIIIPIAAVLIGQWLQDRAKKREDKMNIFKTLMTARIYGWTVASVQALNIIDIVFADDKSVRDAWKDLYEKYSIQNPNEVQKKAIETARCKLLETMANSLGYKEKVTWETIQNPYIPQGLVDQINMQTTSQNNYNALLGLFATNFSQQKPQAKTENEDTENE